MTPERILFGDFELDATNFELRRGPTRIKLERIPMDLLILLARNEGRLVQRTEVVETIWGKGRFLETDSAINTAIRKVRRALGDNPTHPIMIDTIPGKGYRFIAIGTRQGAADNAKALYAKGLHFWNRKTPDSYLQAIQFFQESIDSDPEYAMPYLGLAKTWILFGIHGLQPSADVYPRARAAASKALELDSQLAEAYAAMADVIKGYDWDWEGAESYYQRALKIDPKCGIAHQWYANLLSIVGRHNEAIQHASEARTLDPLSVGATGFVGFTYFRARRYQEALRESESALTLEPNSPIANWFLGQVLTTLKRFPEAEIAFSKAVEESHAASMYLSALGYLYATSGDRVRASEILARLQCRSLEHYVSPLDIAIVSAAMGEMDAAFECLNTAVQGRVMRLTELTMPMFDSLRDHPQFHALLIKLALNAG
ncbi:MAG: winged helix-turn-helix domain-containing protein [Acidobacteriaceae bacterium]